MSGRFLRTVTSPSRMPRGFRLLAILFVLVLTYGTVGYSLLGFGVIDALYMTALAVTTLGFTPPKLSGAEKLFTASLAVLGVITFVAVITVVVEAVAEGQLGNASRRRRMQRRIENLRSHIIVCAYGRVGRTVAREIEAASVPFVVIDVKEELEQQMGADGVFYVIGDPSSERVLRQAGIERARGMVCAVDSDATNVYIALLARSLNPELFIVARASEAQSADRLFRAGANRVVSPYVTSARHMALLAMRPAVVDSLDLPGLGERQVRLDELVVEKGSNLLGRGLGEACGQAVPLLLVRPDGQIVPDPDPGRRLEEGDLILLLGEPAALRPAEES